MRRLRSLLPAIVLAGTISLILGAKSAQRPDRGSLAVARQGPQVPLLPGRQVTLGPPVTTPYGIVQVQITVRAGRLEAVRAMTLPDSDDLSVQLSRVAEPVLQRESLASQARQIDAVSGATWTSDGYRRSLQAALDSLRG